MYFVNMCKSSDRLYNKFFYVTVCHVCKYYGEKVVLKMCNGCRLISYCSKEHQKLHWPQHKDLCQAVRYVRETCSSEFSQLQENTMTQLVHLKMKVALRLERKLLPYEVQMFMYARMCLVCKKQDCYLTDCPTCMSVSFCKDHDRNNNHNKASCDLLRMAFTAYLSLSFSQGPVCVGYMPHITKEKIFSNMREFLNIYGDTIKASLKSPYKLFEIEQSMNFTRPLTVIKGMRLLDFIPQKKSLVLHIISSIATEVWWLPCWEIILHLVSDIRSLKLIMIGPEQVTCHYKLKLCNNCKQDKKKIPIEWLGEFYEDYVEEATFNKPDLVIGFHPGFCRYNRNEEINRKKWVPSIQTLAKQNCPLILTCFSEIEARLDTENINLTLGKDINYLYCGKNPFSGYRPYRQSDDESQFPVYFENYYLVVYKNLCP